VFIIFDHIFVAIVFFRYSFSVVVCSVPATEGSVGSDQSSSAVSGRYSRLMAFHLPVEKR